MTFPVELPGSATAEEIEQWLSVSGFTKVQAQREVATPTGPRQVLDVVADRFRLSSVERARVLEAIEVALKHGSGRMTVYALGANADTPDELWRFSTGLHCPDSDRRYTDPIASMFSFNSAVGACDTCRGFGRVIGVDYGLVMPNDKLTLRAGVDQTHANPGLERSARRFDAPCRGGRHSPRHAVEQDDAGAPAMGHQRLAQLEWQVEPALVWHQALL